jgi:hypothetical protein
LAVDAVDCHLAVVERRPLRVHFSLINPAGSDQPLRVPAVIAPAGAFVRIEVRDADGRLVHETERPKLKLKLDPRAVESYVTLQPGYSFGALLELDRDDLWLEPGSYLIRADYQNHEFSGPESDPIGELTCSASAELTL